MKITNTEVYGLDNALKIVENKSIDSNMVGSIYGDYTVLSYEFNKNNQRNYKVKCNICGNEK